VFVVPSGECAWLVLPIYS